jgi:hypothetical protein
MKKSIIYIPDDMFGHSEMRFFRICLKSGTNSHTEGNIWLAGCEVEKLPYHTSIESRINWFTFDLPVRSVLILTLVLMRV